MDVPLLEEHHLYWPKRKYGISAIASAFRDLPLNKVYMLEVEEAWLHDHTTPPAFPTEEFMARALEDPKFQTQNFELWTLERTIIWVREHGGLITTTGSVPNRSLPKRLFTPQKNPIKITRANTRFALPAFK